jgi:hypothetical protein
MNLIFIYEKGGNMGEMRNYRAYLSISASGPLLNVDTMEILNATHTDMRPRALAELAYTTADVDFLEGNWASINYDTAPKELHLRLKNPTIEEFRIEMSQIQSWFSHCNDKDDWDGGCITFTYAGHGREADGALVLEDGNITWDSFLSELLTLVPENNGHRLRVIILLDSCYSGNFLTELQHTMRDEYSDKFSPYYSAAACLHDEVAREFRSLGHGLFTYCFSVNGLTPESMVAEAIQPDNTFGPSLSLVKGPYGCSFLTQGAQNPIVIDGDEMTVCGEPINLYDTQDNLLSKDELYSQMSEIRGRFRYLFSGFTFPDGTIFRSDQMTNADITNDLIIKKDLLKSRKNFELDGTMKEDVENSLVDDGF